MRLKEHHSLLPCGGASGAGPERWLPRPYHITCRAGKRCSAPRRLADFPTQRRHELRQNGACHQQIWQEKTRTVTARRHDTLCVRGVCSLFFLEQVLAAFGDSNYGGKTYIPTKISGTGVTAKIGHGTTSGKK